jgi:hypothetical protein
MPLKKLSPLVVLLAANALAGCPGETEESLPAPIPSSEPAPAASSATLEPALPTSTSRIKLELDGRQPDITKGVALAIKGATVSFTAPASWNKSTSESYTVATAPDGKARFSAGSYGADVDPTTQLEAAARALGLSGCSWDAADTATVGKDALPASVADGVCKRDGNEVKAGYATFSGEGSRIVSMGGWDEGGDADGMFGTFRSIAKSGSAGGSGIASCCSALLQNANIAPPEQKGGYLAAAGACRQIVDDPRGRAALAQVRAMLTGLDVPLTCR